MKKIITITGIVMLLLTVSYPLYAAGPGWGGRGERFMGFGMGPGSRWGGSQSFGALTEEERTKLDALHEEFRNETAPLRDKIVTKTRALHTLLNASDLDVPKARAIQKEISDLQAQLAQKRLDLLIKTKKILPEGFPVREFGKGRGRGFGPRWMR